MADFPSGRGPSVLTINRTAAADVWFPDNAGWCSVTSVRERTARPAHTPDEPLPHCRVGFGIRC